MQIIKMKCLNELQTKGNADIPMVGTLYSQCGNMTFP